MKYNHFVIILESDNRIKYVTKINNATKVARWEDGKPAMKMTKTAAENLVFGLVANGFHAAVVRMPSFIDPVNEGTAEEEKA